MIGQEIPREEIKSILTSLDIKINNVSETTLGLSIPSYRVDVTRPADVVEEILRVYGYNRIDFSDRLIDRVEYDDAYPWPTEPDGNGPTLELIHPDSLNEYGTSWSFSESNGTPGYLNSIFEELNLSEKNKLQESAKAIAFMNKSLKNFI